MNDDLLILVDTIRDINDRLNYLYKQDRLTISGGYITQSGILFGGINGQIIQDALFIYDDVNNGLGIGIIPGASIHISRGTLGGGTAQFDGTTNSTHINYSTNEDTYIRGGKATSNVIIGDTNTSNAYVAIKKHRTSVGDDGDGLEINVGGSGNRNAYIDFHSQDGTDYDSRIIKGTGSSSNFIITNAGVGSIEFQNNGATRLYIDNAGNVHPNSAGAQSLGTATYYWNDVSYKTLTDRGCLGLIQEVELSDSRKVSNTEALKSIKVHDTKKTVYDAPMLDYATLPKVVYKPAPLAEEDEGPIKKGEKLGEDGAETTALISIMLGAIRELSAEIDQLKQENKELKTQVDKWHS